ncbi:MAG TPA: thioesterase family protein [Pseudogracilibacillus sp.]|nr:thioesterase family protein [Pseudogracilibacillus sp.]
MATKFSYIEDMKVWRQEFQFYIPIKIRFSETDMFGHMNNVSPFIYFEEARIDFMKHVGIFNLSTEPESVPIVADLQCDYQKQVYFDEHLKLYVKVDNVGNSSMDIHYMALNQQEDICFTGRGKIVNINPTTGKPIPLTEEVKEKVLMKNKA